VYLILPIKKHYLKIKKIVHSLQYAYPRLVSHLLCTYKWARIIRMRFLYQLKCFIQHVCLFLRKRAKRKRAKEITDQQV